MQGGLLASAGIRHTFLSILMAMVTHPQKVAHMLKDLARSCPGYKPW